jgi:hypothetical protein
MKAIVYLLICIFVLTSCAASKTMQSIIPQNTINEIPLNASKIIVINNTSIEQNFNIVYKNLLSNDYKIEKDNKEMGYILASASDYGDTQVRLNIVCEDNKISITSEWKPGMNSVIFASSLSGVNITSDWNKAQWTKHYDKPNIAFARSVNFAKLLNAKITYK